MSQPLITFIESINDNHPARLKVTLNNGEPAQLDCTFKITEAPDFALLFPPKSLVEEIEVNQIYTVELVSDSVTLLD